MYIFITVKTENNYLRVDNIKRLIASYFITLENKILIY